MDDHPENEVDQESDGKRLNQKLKKSSSSQAQAVFLTGTKQGQEVRRNLVIALSLDLKLKTMFDRHKLSIYR